MKIVDMANCLIQRQDLLKQMSFDFIEDGVSDSGIKLKMVGIRPGEKLHEELISEEEWLRTEEHDNFLIGTKTTNDELWSYNSRDSLMDDSETYQFLKDSGVIK